MKTITAVASFFLYASVSYAHEVKNDTPSLHDDITDQEASQVLKSLASTNGQVSELEGQVLDELEARLNHAAEQYTLGALKLIEEKADQFKPQGPRLGIMLHKTEDDDVFVSKVIPNSGAEKSGIKYADRILSVNHVKIEGAKHPIRTIAETMQEIEPEEKVQVVVSRDGKRRKFSVTTSAFTPPTPKTFKMDVGVISIDGSLKEALSVALNQALNITDWDEEDANESNTKIMVRSFRPDVQGCFNTCKGCSSIGSRNNGPSPLLLDLNPDLGKYFGVDTGVLVLSAGTTQKDLKSGDVLLSIAGEDMKNVASARARLFTISEPTSVRVLRDNTELDVLLQPVLALPNRHLKHRRFKGNMHF